MTSRERFLAICRFEKPDRQFLWPEAVSERLSHCWPESAAKLVAELPFDRMTNASLGTIGIDIGPVPRFREKILKAGQGVTLVRTSNGKIRRHVNRETGSEASISHTSGFPVYDSEDFARLAPRYRGAAARLPGDWDAKVEEYSNRDEPLVLKIRGFFGACLGWMGYERLCESFYLQPQLIHRMMDHWFDFLSAIMQPVLEARIVDCVMVAELGLAHTGGPSIAPDLIGEFLIPRYRKLIGLIRETGVEFIWLRNKGNLSEMLPLFLETGINGVSNLNRLSGNDPAALRRQYPKLMMMGGLDKRWLLDDAGLMANQIQNLVPSLITSGGYFPCLDGGLLEDTPLDVFLKYVDVLKRACGLS